MATLVRHRWMTVAGVETFYREAGREDAPVLLLPHGYPCSSYEFRNLMPRLADRWRLIAPDFPGAGYSGTPDDFDYSFDGYAAWLEAFIGAMKCTSGRRFCWRFTAIERRCRERCVPWCVRRWRTRCPSSLKLAACPPRS